MARKTTIITSITGSGGGGGAVVLGAVGVVAGLLAVDHYYSRRGQSAFDRLTRGFRTSGYFTGFDGPWNEMTGKISVPMQSWVKQVVSKAVDSESGATLQQLAANLAAAGLNQLADAVRAAAQNK